MSGKKDSQNSKKKFRFPFSRKKHKPVVIHQKNHISSAKFTKLPQMSHEGLSYAGQHLLLVIQHAVDEQKVKVSHPKNSDWGILITQNPDLAERKQRIKAALGIHHFSDKELEKIAFRVSEFVAQHQPHMVNI